MAFILACLSAFDGIIVINFEVVHVLVIEILQVKGSKIVIGRITVLLLVFLGESRKILLDLLLDSFGDFLSHEGMTLTFGFLFGFFSLLGPGLVLRLGCWFGVSSFTLEMLGFLLESEAVFGVMIAVSMQETVAVLLRSRLARRVLRLAIFLGSWLGILLRDIIEILFSRFLTFHEINDCSHDIAHWVKALTFHLLLPRLGSPE